MSPNVLQNVRSSNYKMTGRLINSNGMSTHLLFYFFRSGNNVLYEFIFTFFGFLSKFFFCFVFLHTVIHQVFLSNRKNLCPVYDIKHSDLIQIICTQLYDKKYSYPILIICILLYDIKYSYQIQIILHKVYDITYSYLIKIICAQLYDIKYSYLIQITCT